MAVIIAESVLRKIGQTDHGELTEKEVLECFLNHCGLYCEDLRPEHQSHSGAPTLWFVAETNDGKQLKITIVLEDGDSHLKSAYPATEKVQRIYLKYAK